MLRNEWSLIASSLLVQLAAGIFIFFAVFRMILSGSTDNHIAIYFTSPGMAITGPIIFFGMILSLFHLGSPFRAYRSVINLDSSWLSREVFFTGAFFALWLIYFVMETRGITNPYVIGLTMLAGILSVVSMASIYHATGKPGWSSLNTYAGFLGSVIILGSISSTAVAIYGGSNSENVTDLLTLSMLLTLVVLAIRWFQQLALFKKLKPDDSEWSINNLVSGSSLDQAIISRYKTFILWGWILSFLGVCFALFMLKNGGAIPNTTFVASVIMVFTGEFLGRCGFYVLGPE